MKTVIEKIRSTWAALPTPSRYTAQILAILLLVFVSVVGFRAASDDRDAIVEASKQAVLVGCRADKTNANILRGILDSQIAFVKRSQEPPPPTIEDRVEVLEKQKASIVVPNCSARAKELADLVVE